MPRSLSGSATTSGASRLQGWSERVLLEAEPFVKGGAALGGQAYRARVGVRLQPAEVEQPLGERAGQRSGQVLARRAPVRMGLDDRVRSVEPGEVDTPLIKL